MQESRLFKIVYYLLDKGKATAPELAALFEVSLRTIYRDIDAISSAGIPIYAQTGRNGGIHLYDDFVLRNIILSHEEKQDILSALQSFLIVGQGERATLTKLSALFQIHSDDTFEIDFSRWGEVSQDNQKFNDLRFAILQHRYMEIMYVNSFLEESKRRIQPRKLQYKSKSWYLKAYCEERKAVRIFKLHRILEWTILEDAFQPIPLIERMDEPPVVYPEIILSFAKEAAYRVYDEFDPIQIEVQRDGRFFVTAHMPEDEWLIQFLLSFGTYVIVIKPTYLKTILAQQAHAIYLKNKE